MPPKKVQKKKAGAVVSKLKAKAVFSKLKAKAVASPKKKALSPATLPDPPAAAPRLQFDAVKVAKEVLRLSQTGQHEAILRVLGDVPTEAMAARKAFLRISMLIHPDKLSGVPEATKAFQALVAAFDLTQMKGVPMSTQKTQHATIARSNEGCFKHQILCPRCEGPWGKSSDGNPDYFYNFMMEGLKCFTCSTCLLKFGCLTAIHLCPYCKGPFEYFPDQYHQKVMCGNPCCNKRFGFILFQASERALINAREQLRREFEAERRHREQNEERAKRLARRLGDYDKMAHEEKCFEYGLRDTCPRCGKDLSEEMDDQAQLRHLRNCTDQYAHRQHQVTLERKATTAKKATAQHNAAAGAIFNFCGGGASQLWLLPPEQLKRLCAKENLAANGSRNELIERIAEHYNKGNRKTAALVDLPKNLHSLSAVQLSAVCAAHCIKGASTREERIDALEELATGVPSIAPKALKSGEGQSKPLALKDNLQGGKRAPKGQTAPRANIKASTTPPRKNRRITGTVN